MDTKLIWLFFVLQAGILLRVEGHSYSLGTCPIVEPQSEFEMRKMLGLWYVIQKTSTGSHCITYNFTKDEDPFTYKVEQVSQHFALGLTPLKHDYHYTGKLKTVDPAVPAKMTVRFQLSVAGSAAFTIFMTDYDHYAAIFTCQKLAFAHRQSATILSREKTLEKMYVDKIRARLSSFNVDPYELSIISQRDCPKGEENGTNINIDDETFSAQSVANVFKKAGEKIGEGVEYIAGGAKKAYDKVAHQHEETKEHITETARFSNSGVKIEEQDAEWLP